LNILYFILVKTPKEEIEKIDSDETEENKTEQDSKILINNRSIIGSAIIKRVKKCPNTLCKKLNVKIDQDNWIVCNGCMKQFCFLCGHGINGAQHFEKKCERYTVL
jgi:hypothetical protein